jgi:hypothetical protein
MHGLMNIKKIYCVGNGLRTKKIKYFVKPNVSIKIFSDWFDVYCVLIRDMLGSRDNDWALIWTILGSVPGRSKRFFSSLKHPDRLWGPNEWVPELLPRRQSTRNLKIIHLYIHVMRGLIMSGTVA